MSDGNDVGPTSFADVARFTETIPGAIHADGSVDEDGYAAAVVEMGAAGRTAAVLITWARLLASTHADGAGALAFSLAAVTDPQLRERTRVHGCELVDLARRTWTGDDPALFDHLRQTQTALGDDIGGLIRVLAAATAPVLRAVGGLDYFDEATEEVVGYVTALAPLTPMEVLWPMTAGLSAIAAGNLEPARTYLGLCTPQQQLTVLLWIAPVILDRPATVISIDEAGVLDGDGEYARKLVGDLLKLIDALGSDDRQQFVAVTAAVEAASDEDQRLVMWFLALTVGRGIGEHVAASYDKG